MTKKRTKLAKIKAQARRQAQNSQLLVGKNTTTSTNLNEKTTLAAPKQEKILAQNSLNQLIGYNVSLIHKDLFKNLLITVLFIAVLLAIFLYT